MAEWRNSIVRHDIASGVVTGWRCTLGGRHAGEIRNTVGHSILSRVLATLGPHSVTVPIRHRNTHLIRRVVLSIAVLMSVDRSLAIVCSR